MKYYILCKPDTAPKHESRIRIGKIGDNMVWEYKDSLHKYKATPRVFDIFKAKDCVAAEKAIDTVLWHYEIEPVKQLKEQL